MSNTEHLKPIQEVVPKEHDNDGHNTECDAKDIINDNARKTNNNFDNIDTPISNLLDNPGLSEVNITGSAYTPVGWTNTGSGTATPGSDVAYPNWKFVAGANGDKLERYMPIPPEYNGIKEPLVLQAKFSIDIGEVTVRITREEYEAPSWVAKESDQRSFSASGPVSMKDLGLRTNPDITPDLQRVHLEIILTSSGDQISRIRDLAMQASPTSRPHSHSAGEDTHTASSSGAQALMSSANVPWLKEKDRLVRTDTWGESFYDGANWQALTVTGAPPTGAASGDLAGTYPNPTVGSLTLRTIGVDSGDSPYTAAANDSLIEVDTSGGAVTIIMRETGTISDGVVTRITDISGNAATNPITIAKTGGDTISSYGSKVIDTAYGSVTLTADSTDGQWNVISDDTKRVLTGNDADKGTGYDEQLYCAADTGTMYLGSTV